MTFHPLRDQARIALYLHSTQERGLRKLRLGKLESQLLRVEQACLSHCVILLTHHFSECRWQIHMKELECT